MKRLVCLILMLMSYVAFAQGQTQSQTLEFFYIAHDRTTPVNDLCSQLEQVYETALSYGDYAVIFYMPNYDEPLVVKINLPGDNRDDFKRIISELRLKSQHEIYVDKDVEAITEIFNTHDFITESGQPAFTSVLLCWYVNPEFWLFQYNEAIIATLYFNFEMEEYHKSGYMTTQVWHAAGDGLEERVNKRYPFGRKNLCHSMNFVLMPY